MSKPARAICFYLHMHQPFRLRHYSVFDTGVRRDYWDEPVPDARNNNEAVLRKVANKSYRPTLAVLKELLNKHPEFCFSLSITGTLIEQLEAWAPDVIDTLKELVATKRVEVLGETYYHSLAFFYSKPEFERQVKQHADKINQLFGLTPKVLRNTELSYNNDLAYWADQAGYKGIITEGWDPVLGWRSPNFMYRPAYTKNIRLLLKNYRLSDDVAFRFSNQSWAEWPLTADKYAYWVNELPHDERLINLFMDFETFGEHQWEHTKIFEFLRHLPAKFLSQASGFMTISQAIDAFEPVDSLDIPNVLTWADTERDLSAWLGNAMQQEAMREIYDLEHAILAAGDKALMHDWRRLQTSDHAYYMCTKWFNDGDIHAYFSAYNSPYDAFIYFSNVLRDLKLRLLDEGGAGG